MLLGQWTKERKLMKDKNVAGILALFLGWLGVHRFYLGQIGRGIVYLIFSWFPLIWLIALIDAIVLLTMDQQRFDDKYNTTYSEAYRRARQPDYERTRRHRRVESRRVDYRRTERKPARKKAAAKTSKANPHKLAGLQKFKDYDYEGAIEEFKKSLEIAPTDVATHFNLACAYSLTENADMAFRHLELAVAHGFKDFKKIEQHPALAFLRIQEQYEDFVENGYRTRAELPPAEEDNLLDSSPDLLDQLKKLGDLKEKGLLTQQEFEEQKRKLLG